MKQTVEMKKEAFEALMRENGFERTGEAASDGTPIYARVWSRVSKVAFHGDMESSYKIIACERSGFPIIRTYENGRHTSTRDYSSPKRAMNAIKEIIQYAGYSMADMLAATPTQCKALEYSRKDGDSNE